MKYREPCETDQDGIEEAYILLLELIEKHQHKIEPALWVSAMVCALSETHEKSKVPFKMFKKEMTECVNHYKY